MKEFKIEDVLKAIRELSIDLSLIPFSVIQKGMNVELEHGSVNSLTNITDDDPVLTAKIALAHIHESLNYYNYLEEIEEKMEQEKLVVIKEEVQIGDIILEKGDLIKIKKGKVQ